MVPLSDSDIRYGKLVPKPAPDANAVIYYLLDASGSTVNEPLITAQNAFFVIHKALRLMHRNLKVVMVSHTTEPRLHTEGGMLVRAEAGRPESDINYLKQLGYTIGKPEICWVAGVQIDPTKHDRPVVGF